MNKLLVQLGIVFVSAVLFSGCSKEASVPATKEKDAYFEPVPTGLPVFVDIDEAIIADADNVEGASALYSYQIPENAAESAQIIKIFSADSRLVLSLNTLEDEFGRSDVTLLVRNDSVYSVDHESNQIRLLSHFTNKVCELIPRERVQTTDGISTDKVLTVLHDEIVYVKTVAGSGSNACQSDGKQRFYALPLDYQLDPTQNPDENKLPSLELVPESEVRSRLVFGWVEDTDNSGQQILSHGFLGYSPEEKMLVFYDQDREIQWQQSRTIEALPVVSITPETKSKAYLFDVQALSDHHYLIQLGLDVFVVDSASAIFAKGFNETDTILADRSLRISPSLFIPETQDKTPIPYAKPADIRFDDDDLLLINDNKIFYQSYRAQTPARNPSETYQIIQQHPISIDSRAFTKTRHFSQFDLKSCGSDADCLAAHDVEAQSWQFITACDAALGCTLNDQVDDYCETAEEKLITQSSEPLCTPSNYLHLSELNKPGNDLSFKGYMQYAAKFARSLDFALNAKRLYITARMHQKELLLSYNYAVDLAAPKASREQVLFGKRARLFGLETHFLNTNLFLNALTEGSLRTNECYKKYQRVQCDLGQINESGSNIVCTGKDLQEGLCTNQFREYEARALFCLNASIQDQSCSDSNLGQIAALSVENSDEDAKWLKLYDFSASSSPAYQMHLLVGDNDQAIEEAVINEGRLLNPQVYSVDPDLGQPLSLLGVATGLVEQAGQGWIVKTAQAHEVEVLAHFQVIADELTNTQSSGLKSQLVHYLIEQSFADANSTTADTIKVQRTVESYFDRP